MSKSYALRLVVVCFGLIACGDDDGRARLDGGGGDDAGGGATCRDDSDCNDGVFCNGVERCLPSHDDANDNGCVPGIVPMCNDGLDCTDDICSHASNGCRFVAIDADGDGHAAASCMTLDGEVLGDDCDDADAQAFPGNPETCVTGTEDRDEDCDPTTIGQRDLDGDIAIDAACCNGARCGDDCDDNDPRKGPDYPEICDEIDNDCDNRIDVETIQALWYPDADGDGFGRPDDNPTESCAPVPGHSLFDTDLDDTRASINPAANEICDTLDNDCDGLVDEDDVCVCGTPGATPCECTAGTLDCLGDLIPRTCVSGHWITSAACSGLKPYCVFGRCVCPDGSDSCTAVPDRSPPFIVASAPAPDAIRISTAGVVSIVLSEPPAHATINEDNFRLIDGAGNDVPATRTVDGSLVMLTPEATLRPGHFYRIVFENVTDRVGNAMRISHAWQFTTAVVDRQPISLCAEPGYDFTLRSLAVGSGGHAAISGECARTGGQVPVQKAVVYRFEANAWVSTGWLAPTSANGPTIGIGVDGTLAAVTIGQPPVLDTLALGQAGWGDTMTSVGITVARALAIGGDRHVLVSGDINGVAVTVGPLGDTPTNIATSAIPAAATYAVATNARGDVALIALDSDGITLAHWNGAAWLARTFAEVGAAEPRVRIAEDGKAVASWLHEEMRQVSDTLAPFDVQHAARFDADAIDDFVTAQAPLTASHQILTDVVWLTDASALLTRSDQNVNAQRLSIDGTLSPSVNLEGPIGGTRWGHVDVAALPNGNAIVVWPHGNSAFGDQVIVAARFTDGAWQPVECLIDAMYASSPQIEALPDGRVIMAWKEGTGGRSMILE